MQGHLLTCEEEVDLCNELRVLEEDRWLDLLLRAKCKKVGGVRWRCGGTA